MQDDILDFWFAPRGSAECGKTRKLWFRKDAAVDQSIRARFGGAVETALAGGFSEWTTPRGALARVLLLDQFTRNIYRQTPLAFAGDILALSISRAAVANRDDQALMPVERWFLYLPFEHAEDRAAQETSLQLFARLRDETGLSEPVVWAERHAAVVRRFGRYPHRNAILGRESTVAEIEYLATRGRGF
ncbi:MAG TPA: DUF924 family protein [Casimicrobiaceae bacterium]|jgi:uncharacterized protein (DUF924 family)|nr:DUF924 family protein [Casimicrobiaceae bacterium]